MRPRATSTRHSGPHVTGQAHAHGGQVEGCRTGTRWRRWLRPPPTCPVSNRLAMKMPKSRCRTEDVWQKSRGQPGSCMCALHRQQCFPRGQRRTTLCVLHPPAARCTKRSYRRTCSHTTSLSDPCSTLTTSGSAKMGARAGPAEAERRGACCLVQHESGEVVGSLQRQQSWGRQ